MTGVVAAAAGFLLGVLWMDLMFDGQVRSVRGVLDEPALASIAGYYNRATTSQSRGALIAVVMVALPAPPSRAAWLGRSTATTRCAWPALRHSSRCG